MAIQLTITEYDEQSGASTLLVRLLVDSDRTELISGDEAIAEQIKATSVIDANTSERITQSSNPLRWAQLLPGAFRSGSLAATTEEVEAHVPALAYAGRASGGRG
jgi:hypothetical protein